MPTKNQREMTLDLDDPESVAAAVRALHSAGHVYPVDQVHHQHDRLRARLKRAEADMLRTAEACWLDRWKHEAIRSGDSGFYRDVMNELERRAAGC